MWTWAQWPLIQRSPALGSLCFCGAERHQGNSKNAIKRSEDGVPEAWAVPARPGGTSEEDWRKESE